MMSPALMSFDVLSLPSFLRRQGIISVEELTFLQISREYVVSARYTNNSNTRKDSLARVCVYEWVNTTETLFRAFVMTSILVGGEVLSRSRSWSRSQYKVLI